MFLDLYSLLRCQLVPMLPAQLFLLFILKYPVTMAVTTVPVSGIHSVGHMAAFGCSSFYTLTSLHIQLVLILPAWLATGLDTVIHHFITTAVWRINHLGCFFIWIYLTVSICPQSVITLESSAYRHWGFLPTQAFSVSPSTPWSMRLINSGTSFI